ncbi:PilZ domain-containing protein [Ramlibacter tataouinensis]|uniref:PilZ domain-containing protein n=1 Tax=Ramlibacter tataouinensis TaxID=94132 RepID=UPI0022F3EBC6|nr:PilZ domain-containing protein [Ramlibacter tataouinensis]WBY01792.1 PilZ domain-containing protein [Ramlibacter tataouinensis]
MQDGQQSQRAAERFGLALPITMEGEECASHDISATGVLLECPAAPALGATVSLTLQYRAEGQEFSLDCRGEVVRVQRHGENWNIAVRLSKPLFADTVPQEGGTG